MKYSRYARKDPRPDLPFETDEEESPVAFVAILMLMVALLLWFFP